MADQVNSTGSSASGLPLALAAIAAPRGAPEAPRPIKTTEVKPQSVGSKPAIDAGQTPDVAMDKLNNYLEKANSEIQFQVDKSTGRTVFQIINQSSGAVVMQVPSEEILAMARNLQALDKSQEASGVLVNKEG